jgi:hypothetical protein
MSRGSFVVSAVMGLLGTGPLAGVADAKSCFKNEDVLRTLPLPPSWYPKELQGVFWMDQGGYYGHSDVPVSAPDLAFTFGDTAYSKWNPQNRTISVATTGPAWTWMNSIAGYAMYTAAHHSGAYYDFQGNADLSYFDIKPSGYMPGGPYSMKKVTPGPGVSCPPPPGTSKDEIVKCAAWDRISHMLGKEVHYYVWQIGDAHGNPIQPYYDEYIKFANSKSSYLGPCHGGSYAFRGTGSTAALDVSNTNASSIMLDSVVLV